MRKLWREGILAAAGALFVLLMAGCGPSYPECYDDETCQEEGRSEWCVNATCMQCRADDHCVQKFDRSYVCESGTCSKIVGFCDPPEFPCPAGQRCRDNRCGPECLDDTECPDTHTCENGRCVPKPQCVTDADCPPGQICQNGVCVTPPRCQMRQIYFDFDESAIRVDAKQTLEENATCWKTRREEDAADPAVQVTGHCDERGTEEYNMALGERRAEATKKALGKLGVVPKTVSTRSRGEYELVVPNATTEAEHQRNRRCEFTLQ